MKRQKVEQSSEEASIFCSTESDRDKLQFTDICCVEFTRVSIAGIVMPGGDVEQLRAEAESLRKKIKVPAAYL